MKELAMLRQATALGRMDFWVLKGWVTPEEWLYPQVQEALSAVGSVHRYLAETAGGSGQQKQ